MRYHFIYHLPHTNDTLHQGNVVLSVLATKEGKYGAISISLMEVDESLQRIRNIKQALSHIRMMAAGYFDKAHRANAVNMAEEYLKEDNR